MDYLVRFSFVWLGHHKAPMGESNMPEKKDALEQAKERDDGWSRFERAVDAAAKSGPIHKAAVKSKERSSSKGAPRKAKAP
jgi:hypothetical protein